MRTAVHPDRPPLLVRAEVHLDGQEILRIGIALVPDAELHRTAEDVAGVIDLALVLGDRAARDVPAVGVEARGLVDRQAGVVAPVAAGHAIHLILVVAPVPFAFEADLRRCRPADCERKSQHEKHFLHGRHYGSTRGKNTRHEDIVNPHPPCPGRAGYHAWLLLHRSRVRSDWTEQRSRALENCAARIRCEITRARAADRYRICMSKEIAHAAPTT